MTQNLNGTGLRRSVRLQDQREAEYLRGNQQEEGSVQEHDVERLDGKEIARRDLMKQRINFAKNRSRNLSIPSKPQRPPRQKLGLRHSVRLDVRKKRGAGYLRDNQQEDVDIQMGDFQEGSVQEDVVMSDIKRLDREKIARRDLRKQRMNFANNRSRNLSKSSKAQRPPRQELEHHGALPELSPMLDVSTENQREIIYTWDTDSEKMDIGAIPAYARTTLQVDFHAIPWPMIPFPQTTEVLDDILNMDPDEATEKLIKYIKPLASDMGLIRNLYIAFHPDHWSRHTYPGLIKFIDLISKEIGCIYRTNRSTVSNVPPGEPEDTSTESQEACDIPHVYPDPLRRETPHSHPPRQFSTNFPAQSATGKKHRIFEPCKKGTETISWDILTEPRIEKLDPEAKFPEVPIRQRRGMGRGRT
ncbi:hypothetical protein B0H14DRAFT_3143685 [Mycena olivaceomarginata]|nr:hypothetical protein B0H14DRAFT_3143685 [Mycena olivaceomarginata]